MKKLLFFIGFTLFISCASTHKKTENDYYKIANLQLEKVKSNRDSVYMFEPLSKIELKKSIEENKLQGIFSRINLFNSHQYNEFKNFLKKEINIDFEKEKSYLKKQIKEYQVLDKNKLSITEKVKFFPRPLNLKDTLKYFSYNFQKNTFGIARPLFTRNGKYGLTVDYGKLGDDAVYILIYKKNERKWSEYKRYLVSYK